MEIANWNVDFWPNSISFEKKFWAVSFFFQWKKGGPYMAYLSYVIWKLTPEKIEVLFGDSGDFSGCFLGGISGGFSGGISGGFQSFLVHETHLNWRLHFL